MFIDKCTPVHAYGPTACCVAAAQQNILCISTIPCPADGRATSRRGYYSTPQYSRNWELSKFGANFPRNMRKPRSASHKSISLAEKMLTVDGGGYCTTPTHSRRRQAQQARGSTPYRTTNVRLLFSLCAYCVPTACLLRAYCAPTGVSTVCLLHAYGHTVRLLGAYCAPNVRLLRVYCTPTIVCALFRMYAAYGTQQPTWHAVVRCPGRLPCAYCARTAQHAGSVHSDIPGRRLCDVLGGSPAFPTLGRT